MRIKRILAGGLAAAFAGATLLAGGFAAPGLGDYVTVSGNKMTSPNIVVGTGAQVIDVLGAADIGVALAGYATTAGTCASTSSVGVSNGIDVASSSLKLYLGSELNRAKQTLTASDLPTILAKGTAEVDLSGTYTYEQFIELGSRETVFGTSGGSYTDPVLYVDMGSSSALPLYNLTVVFNKVLDLESTDVRGTGELTLFGIDYIISSESNSSDTASENKLVLLGGAGKVTLGLDETAEVEAAGITHEITLDYVDSTTTCGFTVDGKTKDSATEASTYTLKGSQGDVDVYVKNVVYQEYTGSSKVTFIVGSSKITMQDGNKVKMGTSDTNVDGTWVDLVGDNSGISQIVISVAGPDSSADSIPAGTPFADPVFGSFKVAYHGLNPATASDLREEIAIDDSGTTGATLKLTDYRNNEQTITWMYMPTTTPYDIDLNVSSTRKYVVAEGMPVAENDYVVLAPEQLSDFGHLYQLSDINSIGSTSATITLVDAFSGDSKTVAMSPSSRYTSKQFYIDGQAFYAVNASKSDGDMSFVWGGSAGLGNATGTVSGLSDGDLVLDAGTKYTVWPTFRTKNGGHVALVTTVGLAYNTTYDQTWLADNLDVQLNGDLEYPFNLTANGANFTLELPTGDMNITYQEESGVGPELWINGVNQTLHYEIDAQDNHFAITIGNLVYNVTAVAAGGGVGLNFTEIISIEIDDGYFTASENPDGVAVLFIEEKDNTTSDRGVVISTVGRDSNNYVDIEVPHFGTTSYDTATQQSDASITEYVTIPYGTYVKHDSDSRGALWIRYPDEQAISTVAFGANPTFTESSAGGSYNAAVKIQEPVAKFDNEISTSSLSADLILLGGPCVNTLVATLMADDDVTCANFNDNYSTGVIKEYESAFGTSQKALVVAGWTGADTRNLAKMVMAGTVSYAA
ncbi:MAG: S-layer protein [Nanoarchaeota archaeon]